MIRRLAFVALLGVCALPALAKPGKTHPKAEAAATATPAETPEAATPPPVSASSGSTRLRLWKACDSKEGAGLQIRLLPGGGGKGAEVASNAERYQFTSYDDVPAGAGTVEVAAVGQPAMRLGVNLTKGRNYTLLVRVCAGVPVAELLDDAPPTAKDGPAFCVFNLMSGDKGEVEVKLGDALSAHLSAAGGALRAQGLKAAFYQITVSGTDSDGQALRWNAETDLRKVRRATLIICPDAYGRIRPRLIEDGAAGDAG